MALETETETLNFTDNEKIGLQTIFKFNAKELDSNLETYSKVFRALNGIPPNKDDFINALMNQKDIRERSRIPSQLLLRRQVYLRLLRKIYGDVAEACKTWADEELILFIAYKGMGREEAIDFKKAETVGEQGMAHLFNFSNQANQQPQQKKGLLSRFRNKKQEEKYPSNEVNVNE